MTTCRHLAWQAQHVKIPGALNSFVIRSIERTFVLEGKLVISNLKASQGNACLLIQQFNL